MSTNASITLPPPPANFSVDLSDVEPGAIVYTVEQGGTSITVRLDPDQAGRLAAQLGMAAVAAYAAIATIELAKREGQ